MKKRKSINLYQKSGLLLFIFNDNENIKVKSVRFGFLYTGQT